MTFYESMKRRIEASRLLLAEAFRRYRPEDGSGETGGVGVRNAGPRWPRSGAAAAVLDRDGESDANR